MSLPAIVRRRPPEAVAVELGDTLAARPPIRGWAVAALALVGLCGVVATTRLADGDAAAGLWRRAESISDDLDQIHWWLVPAVGALTVMHYLGSALGVRAAADGVAGRRVGLWEMTMAQLAGAAANRVAPAGVASAAITCRYLTRRGLTPAEAAASVAAGGLARAVTKLPLFAVAIVAWQMLGDATAPALDFDRLMVVRSPIVVPAVLGGAGVGLLAVLLVRRRRIYERARAAALDVLTALRHMPRRPRCLLVSLAASTGAHIALALAFAISVLAVPGTGGAAIGLLLAAHLLGSTAGAAIPTPAGVGSTEAALITVLAASHVPAAQAAQAVLLFRAMTFWVPVPAGVLSTRRLRKQGGL